MTVVLICNVGSRDIQIEGKLTPPDQARQVGEALDALDVSELKMKQIAFPIIQQCIDYVKRENCKIDKLLLIASDQEQGPGAKPESDTIYYARILKKLVAGQHGVGKVKLAHVRNNPADYDEMITFCNRQLPLSLADCVEPLKVYLSVSGGTPAMNFALFLVGIEKYGKNAEPLYVSRNSSRPIRLQAGLKIFRKTLQNSLITCLESYDYESAFQLLKDNDDLFDSRNKQKIMQSLCTYAKERATFNFKAAENCLHSVIELAEGRTKRSLIDLRDVLCSSDCVPLSEAFLVEEVIHNAETKFHKGQYLDFLSRLFRFQEGCLRFLAVSLNVKFDRKDLKYLDKNWVESSPELMAEFDKKRLSYDRVVSRPVLKLVVEYLLAKKGSTEFEGVMKSLHQFEKLTELRNKTIVAHDYVGVDRELLETSFEDNPNNIIPLMRQTFQLIAGKEPRSNCFDEINKVCKELLKND
ncbi:MAG: hypothetical protein APF81_12760 [Desulfosporosinus sp. BRH_c37]|nr:MAG: hypothetical protein APF81_12760 [Desulfosporosinus sp. BRH_c37]